MLDGLPGPRERGRVARRLHALLPVAALASVLAVGCSEDASPAPSGSQEEPSAVLEMGAWHELVALPGGVVLVNGYPEGDPDPGPLELWRREGDGDAWARVPVSGERPSGRNFAGVAHDPRSGRLVLYGGLTSEGASDETWLWDGTRWTRAAQNQGQTQVQNQDQTQDQTQDQGAGPGPRSSPGMAVDEASGFTLLYGGDDGSEQYADTWAFDGSTWQQVARQGPHPMRWPALMESDPSGGVVLYGGHQVVDEDGPIGLGDTWVWRGGRWQAVPDADRPGSLVNANGVVHPAHGLLLVGGGDNRGRERGRVWRWTGSGWEAMRSGLVPERQAFGLAYDADRDVVVLTGGLVEPGSTDRHQDTWEWSGDPGTPAEQVG